MRISNFFLAFLFSASITAAPSSASAETLLYDYYSSLTVTDAFNSRGVPLDDICTIAQQDRANWHRFNRRDSGDSGDAFFSTPERRALFGQVCEAAMPYYANAGDRIRSGTRSFYVYVQVFGANGVVTRIVISEGAG